MKHPLIVFGLFFSLAFGAVAAQDESSLQPPRLPEPQQSGEALEQDITIVEDERGTVHEYRANGAIYMVKIIPRHGSPYYELDSDGDGELDTRVDDPRNVAVPQWVLFRF